MASFECGYFHEVPIATVAAGTAIDTGHKGTTIAGVLVYAATAVELRDKDGAGAIRFRVTGPGWFPVPIMFKDDVYSSATGALIYRG